MEPREHVMMGIKTDRPADKKNDSSTSILATQPSWLASV
jgi:hypothetical protein